MKTCPECEKFKETHIEIASMNKMNKEGSSLKAFFDINLTESPTAEPLTVYGLRLMEGRDGNLWSAWPSREYTDKQGNKKWQPILRIEDKDFMQRITEAARAVYSGTTPPKSTPKDKESPF